MHTPAAFEDITARAEPRLPIAPGRVLCDRYVLTRILEMGSTYAVFCARDLEATPTSAMPAFVALKTPRPDHPEIARAAERLQLEFALTQRLSHPGIAQVFELGSEGDVRFMAMELIEGESLASILRRQGPVLLPYLVRSVLRGIGDALCYAHAAGVAHGDLNPTNVFVLRDQRIKLTGFAIGPHESPTPAANLAYASPQVLDGETPLPSDDVFSFACIAYEILTGRHPFQQRPANVAHFEGLRSDTPAALTNERAAALQSALSFEREARPHDIRALAKALAPDSLRARRVVHQPEIEPARRDDDRRWWWAAGVCLVAMVASVVLTRIVI